MADDLGWNPAASQKLTEAVGDHEAQEIALALLHRDGQIEQKDRFGLALLLRRFGQLCFQRLAKRIDDCLSEVKGPASPFIHNLPTHGGPGGPRFLRIPIPRSLRLAQLPRVLEIKILDRGRHDGPGSELIGACHAVCDRVGHREIIVKIWNLAVDAPFFARRISLAPAPRLFIRHRLLFCRTDACILGGGANSLHQRAIIQTGTVGFVLEQREESGHRLVQGAQRNEIFCKLLPFTEKAANDAGEFRGPLSG